MHMHDLLHERAAELSRLASTVRTNLDKAEALIPVVNELLSELATMGLTDGPCGLQPPPRALGWPDR